jgi:hypothetical protein
MNCSPDYGIIQHTLRIPVDCVSSPATLRSIKRIEMSSVANQNYLRKESMYHHIKKLMYTVNVGTPDPRFGNMLLEQFGGANGELAAAMQYFDSGSEL